MVCPEYLYPKGSPTQRQSIQWFYLILNFLQKVLEIISQINDNHSHLYEMTLA